MMKFLQLRSLRVRILRIHVVYTSPRLHSRASVPLLVVMPNKADLCTYCWMPTDHR